MKHVLVMLGLVIVAVSGCLSGDDGPGADGGKGGTPTKGYVLDCSISNWDEPCLVHASPNESPSKTEIEIRINPTDPFNVVTASKDLDTTASDCVWSVAQFTRDGGHTWNTSYIGGQIADRQPGEPLYGWGCITDPIMAFDNDGNLFYTLQVSSLTALDPVSDLSPVGLFPNGAFMGMAVSRDGGETWPTIDPLFPGDHFAVFPDYIHMGTNPSTGTVFTMWNTITGLTQSLPTIFDYRDGSGAGAPWIFPISDDIIRAGGLFESSIVGTNDGTVYAFFGGPFDATTVDLGLGPTAAFYATSDNDGLTWSVPTMAFEYTRMQRLQNVSFRDGTVVEFAADISGGARDGCIYGVFNGDEPDAVGGSDIYVRASCDGAAGWTEPVLVNADSREDGQWMPRIAVDGRGTVHVVYMTRHYDPDHQLIDAEWAYSEDGGATWTAKRLTTMHSDGDLGVHQNGSPFFGDYIGIDAVGDHVWMAFPVTHTGVAEIAAAHVQFIDPDGT